jgi:hypothetical protein
MVTGCLLAALLAFGQPRSTPLTLITDNTRIESSCTISIMPGTVIADADNNGVIQIAADDITIEFAPNSKLIGAKPDVAPDAYTGSVSASMAQEHHHQERHRLGLQGRHRGLRLSGIDGRYRRPLQQLSPAPQIHAAGRGWFRLALPAQQRQG